jgi:tetratricopeptide (TPR) repeat protein
VKRLLLASVGLAALVLGVAVAWYGVRQDREFQRLIASGDAALASDETYRAIEAFSGALALRNDSMLAHLKRGDAYRRRGEYAAAQRDLSEAVRLDSSAPQPLEMLGDVSAEMGRHDEAARHYLAFVQLDDRSSRVLYKLGLAYFRGGEPARAIPHLRQAIAIQERSAEAHYLLGLASQETSDDGEALRAMTRAIDINPAFVAAREGLAVLHERAGRRREAIEELEALAALEPARAERLVNVALAYARWGRLDAALSTLARAEERFSGSPVVSAAVGRVWLDAAQESPDDVVSLQRASDALQRSAAAADAPSETLALYGRALLLSGNIGEAGRVLQIATSRLPLYPEALRYLAEAEARLGRPANAREALRRYEVLTVEGRR